MKIAHVLTRFDPDNNPGGVERVVDELTQRQKDKHEIEIICRNQFGNNSTEERNGITIKRAECRDVSGLRTITAIPTMRELIQDSEAEIYHIHDWSPHINYRLTGSPGKSVLTNHNKSEGMGGFLQRQLVSEADKTTFVSQWLKDEIGESDRGIVIPNGVNSDQFTVSSSAENYILFVGTLEPRKGIKEICEASQALGFELKIVGDGDLKEIIEDEYDYEILTNISDEELGELYKKCKCLAVPSRREGFGLVWLEALVSGRPILATKTGVGPQIPDNYGETISTDYTVQDLKNALQKIYEKNFNSEEIRSYAEKNFGWDQIVNQYEEVYTSL